MLEEIKGGNVITQTLVLVRLESEETLIFAFSLPLLSYLVDARLKADVVHECSSSAFLLRTCSKDNFQVGEAKLLPVSNHPSRCASKTGGNRVTQGQEGRRKGGWCKNTEGIEYSTSNTQGLGGEKIRNDKIDEKAAISIIPVLLVTLALSITQGRHGRSSIMA